MSNIDFLIDVYTSISGLKIELWNSDYNHALDGHPEVTVEKIKTAIGNPFKVIQSKKSNRVCLFYSIENASDENIEQLYFCVVVGVIGSGKGRVETAYEANYIKSGTVLMEKSKKG